MFIETSFLFQASWDMHVRVHYMCGQIEKLTDYMFTYVIRSPFAPVSADTTTSVICKSFLWYIYFSHMVDRSINTRQQYEYIHGEYFGQYDTIPWVIIE